MLTCRLTRLVLIDRAEVKENVSGAICFMHFVIVSYSCGINFTHLYSSSEVAWFTLGPFLVMAGAPLVYRGQGGAIEGPMLAWGHRFKISNLHTPHTHRDPHTCAPTETLPPPSLLLYKAVFVIPTSPQSNQKKGQDESITSTNCVLPLPLPLSPSCFSCH